MLIRRLVVVLGLLFLIPSVASADGHRAGLFGGISYARGSWLTGANVSFEHTVTKRPEKYVYVVGDYSFHDGEGFKRQIVLVGANFTGSWNRVSAAGRLLVGNVSGDGSSNVSYAYGASIAFGPSRTSALRQRVHVVPHVQVDHIIRTGDRDSFARVSVGAMVKFPY